MALPAIALQLLPLAISYAKRSLTHKAVPETIPEKNTRLALGNIVPPIEKAPSGKKKAVWSVVVGAIITYLVATGKLDSATAEFLNTLINDPSVQDAVNDL